MALMAATIVASAFVPHDQWLYALKVAAVGAALWWFRGSYVPLLSGAAPLSIAAGLLVFTVAELEKLVIRRSGLAPRLAHG